jgi:transcription antitermination protein NusB
MTQVDKRTHRHRTLARIAAVQSIYRYEMSGEPTEAIIADIRDNYMCDTEDTTIELKAFSLYEKIVVGVVDRLDELDEMISGALSDEWPLERLEAVLRAILRVSVYELLAHGDVPLRVVINEYIDVTHGFFTGNESKIVNGVLDRLGKILRKSEVKD